MNKYNIRWLLIICILFLCSPCYSCGINDSGAPRKKLNGSWMSELLTFEIDVSRGIIKGQVLGALFQREFKIIDEQEAYVILETPSRHWTRPANQIKAIFLANGNIVFETKNSPIVFEAKPASKL